MCKTPSQDEKIVDVDGAERVRESMVKDEAGDTSKTRPNRTWTLTDIAGFKLYNIGRH